MARELGDAWTKTGPDPFEADPWQPSKRALGCELQPERLQEVPEPPAFLLPEAKAEWKRLAPELVELGLLTAFDLQPFALYCQAVGRAEMAERIFAETGGALTIRGARGGEIINPLLRIARDAANEAMRLGAEFGLAQISRTRLRGVGRPHPSKFGDLIR